MQIYSEFYNLLRYHEKVYNEKSFIILLSLNNSYFVIAWIIIITVRWDIAHDFKTFNQIDFHKLFLTSQENLLKTKTNKQFLMVLCTHNKKLQKCLIDFIKNYECYTCRLISSDEFKFLAASLDKSRWPWWLIALLLRMSDEY